MENGALYWLEFYQDKVGNIAWCCVWFLSGFSLCKQLNSMYPVMSVVLQSLVSHSVENECFVVTSLKDSNA